MTKLTVSNVTRQKLLNAMLRTWEKFKWCSHNLALDRTGEYEFRFINGTWYDSDGQTRRKPCRFCAIGAIMYDQNIDEKEVQNLLSKVGLSKGSVITLNDYECSNKKMAIEKMTNLFR